MQDFAVGFEVVSRFLLKVGGGAVAVSLFAAAVLIFLCVAGAMFDLVTSALARRWERDGYTPRNRLGRIILENHKRLGQ